MTGAPDPTVLHPVTGQKRVVFLRALVTDPKIEVGDYTYYDDPTPISGPRPSRSGSSESRGPTGRWTW